MYILTDFQKKGYEYDKIRMRMKRNRQQEIEELQKRVMNKDRSLSSCMKDMNIVSDLETQLKKDFNLETEKKSVLFGLCDQQEKMKQFLSFNRSQFNSLLVIGPKGSGKHSLLNEMCTCAWIDLSRYGGNDEKNLIQDLYQAIESRNEMICFENIEACHPTFLNLIKDLFYNGEIKLNKRYVQNKNQLQDINNNIVSNAISSLKIKQAFISLVYDHSISHLLSLMGTQFMDCFKEVIELETMSKDVIDAIIERECLSLKEKYNCELDVADYYRSCFDSKENGYSLLNCTKTLDKLISSYRSQHQDEIIKVSYDGNILINGIEVQNKINTLDEIKEELNQIVGLEEVKDYILSLENLLKVQQIREQKGLKTNTISKHMFFLGNPGTGKTTIARILAKYLQALKVLSSGQLIEVSRQDLVGKYVGHTAPLTNSVIESALGGILFIDEAYSLYRGKDDSFGLECIDTLVKGMEDHRDNLVVILAGYEKEMNDFLDSNSGLKSRFPNVIHFKDYTSEQLVMICHKICKENDYHMTDCDDALKAYFDLHGTAGNGRLARNMVEEAMLRQANRIMNDLNCDLTELKVCDFKLE